MRLPPTPPSIRRSESSWSSDRVSPVDGFAVLREVSQNTNIKLSSIAEHIVKHAQGVALPDPVLAELRAALARHT
jgi:hypothetical protein